MKRVYYDNLSGAWLVVKEAPEDTPEQIEYIDVEDGVLENVSLFHIENEQIVVDASREQNTL